MNRRVVAVIGGWFVAAVLLAAVATAGSVHLWNAPHPSSDTGESTLEPPTAPPTATLEPPAPGVGGHAADWVGILIEIVVAAAIVVVIALAWRHRSRLPWNRRERIRLEPLPPDVESAIVDDAPAQRDVLRQGDARNAIVACWLRLEAAVEAAGVDRRASDTSTDLTLRVLREHAVDAPALDTLAALFREARFSSHALDERQRGAAIDALDRVHASLGVRLAAAEAAG